MIDVAMTETARLAHYVLPAATQFEKAEATFFNLEFPHNTFHLRHPLMEPLPGTLPEPEIWARLMRALGVVDEAELRPLRRAADAGARRVHRRRSSPPSAPIPGWARCCRSCCTRRWARRCPRGFPARRRCGGWRRRRR